MDEYIILNKHSAKFDIETLEDGRICAKVWPNPNNELQKTFAGEHERHLAEQWLEETLGRTLFN